jgi:hypothetical protein
MRLHPATASADKTASPVTCQAVACMQQTLPIQIIQHTAQLPKALPSQASVITTITTARHKAPERPVRTNAAHCFITTMATPRQQNCCSSCANRSRICATHAGNLCMCNSLQHNLRSVQQIHLLVRIHNAWCCSAMRRGNRSSKTLIASNSSHWCYCGSAFTNLPCAMSCRLQPVCTFEQEPHLSAAKCQHLAQPTPNRHYEPT